MRTVKACFLLTALISVATACSSGDDNTASSSRSIGLSAVIASYDLAAGVPNRIMVGILGGDGGTVVGGTVNLTFEFLGPGQASSATSNSVMPVVAQYVPVATFSAPAVDAPRLSQPGDGPGVYEVRGVMFDRPGNWQATVSGVADGRDFTLTAAFPVLPEHAIVAAGQPAPRTANLLPGDATAPAKAIDSRAGADGSVPDPELHRLTIPDALANGKPTLVVIATPVYCVSRFCGPVTDSVQKLAQRYGDAANFIHIEVWRDYEAQTVNKGAADWIYPDPSVDAKEPWTFLVGRDGVVLERWDNVASDAQLDDALVKAIG